jgi:hypothetical protein
MIIIFAIIIIIIILLCMKKNKEQYNHVSPFYSPSEYIKECGCNRRKQCINSRCIYSTLNECKEKCGKSCLLCPGPTPASSMYMCGDYH